MASPIYKGSKPKILFTLTGLKDVSYNDITLKVELYAGKYDANSVITLTKSDLTPTGNPNEFLTVLSDTSKLNEGAISVRTTIEYTDNDTNKPVKEINVQTTSLTCKAL